MRVARIQTVVGTVCLLVLGGAADAVAAAKWKALDPSTLSAAKPVVQADADAEALFWEVRVADELSMTEGLPRTVLDHYLRIKVFTERGRDGQSNVDIPHINGIVISNVVGRTIKRDGTIVELQKADVFERTIVKAGGAKLKATSFVLPGVEVGAILEYQWRETRLNAVAMYAALDCQRDIPVQLVRYLIKPLEVPEYGIRVEAFNGQNTAFTEDKEERGYLITTMANVAAFKAEPNMPPEHDVMPWLLVYYTPGGRASDPVRFWREYGASVHDAAKSAMKVDGAIRTAAQTATDKLTTVMEKIEALLAVCRTIKRVDLADTAPGADRKVKPAKNPADVLARKEGDDRDVLTLFGALALAAGLDARLAMIPDREEMAHPPNVAHPYFMRTRAVAVRDGNGWRFVNPANAYGAPGMLAPWQEGTRAIVGDPKEPVFVGTAFAEPAASRRRRSIRARILADGTLEGDFTLSYTGHVAFNLRRRDRAQSADEREKSTREFVLARLPGARVSDLKFEHLADQDGDYTISAHVRVPDYAQKTASRMFVVPAIFQQKEPPTFTAGDRRHPISFPHTWSEEDRVVIELPEGYRAEPLGDPGAIDAQGVAGYTTSVQQTDDRTIRFRRDLFFGAGGRVEFPQSAYAALKKFFDRVQELDRFTITLRQSAADQP